MYRKVVTILTHPQTLRKKASSFSPFGQWSDLEHQTIQDLKDTFTVLQGYGLAAPQIGISKRAVIVNLASLGVRDEVVIMVNPEIETYGEDQRNREACFSVPHISAYVNRPMCCRVKYTTESGSEDIIEPEGFPAACLQHEVDHLDGRTYLDRINSAWRGILKNKIRKIEKKRKTEEAAAKEEFEREHREIMGMSQKKTGHSKKRKPKPRKKRPSRSKKKR